MFANAAVTFCGAEGTPGVDDGSTALLVVPPPEPTAFAAVTVNVYVALLVRPETIVENDAPLTVDGPGTAPGPVTRFVDTVYEETAAPPSEGGAVQLTVAEPLPGTA